MLNQKFWEKYFKHYDVLNSAIPYRELIDEIIATAEINKGDLVFDAGSGTGNISIRMRGVGAKPVSLDFSEEGLKRHKKKDPEAETVLGDLTKTLPFADDYFDKIVSNNVIYAIPREKRESLFKEFYRILKPGGVIAVANVHKDFKPSVILFDHLRKSYKKVGFLKTLYTSIFLLYSTIKVLYYNYLVKKEDNSGKYNFVNIDDHKRLFEQAGFKRISKTKTIYSNQSYLNRAFK